MLNLIRCPICEQNFKPEAMEIHHIIEQAWSINNGEKVNNNDYNLQTLCGSCHNLVSKEEIITERKVMTSDGLKLMWRYKDGDWNLS